MTTKQYHKNTDRTIETISVSLLNVTIDNH